MTNTTKNTTKSIFLALSVAMTMSVASAKSIDGMNSSFQFFKPNVANNAVNDTIKDMNNILEHVGATGGSTINNENFWRTFIEPKETKIFNYSDAAEFIEELIFTVNGEVANLYYDPTETNTTARSYGAWKLADSDDITATTADDSVLGNGKKQHGELKARAAKAIQIMSNLGFAMANKDDFGTYTDGTANTLGATVSIGFDPTISTEVTNPTSNGDVSAKILSYATDNGESLVSATARATIDSVAFNNANLLISRIASHLKTGHVLNVENAAKALSKVVGQHNSWLGANVVSEAKKLKDAIKVVGLQTAGVALGKNINNTTCPDTTAVSCVKIGEQFRDINLSIGNILQGNPDALADYNTALVAIDALADQILTFNVADAGQIGIYTVGTEVFTETSIGSGVYQNSTGLALDEADMTETNNTVASIGAYAGVNNYDSLADASNAAAAIYSDLGFITVAGDGTGNPELSIMQVSDWATGESDTTFDLEGFDNELTVDVNIMDAAGLNMIDGVSTGNIH